MPTATTSAGMRSAPPELLAVLMAVTLLLALPAAAQDCQQASFSGRVNGGESYSRPLGQSLVFRLAAQESSGWLIQVTPAHNQDDYAYPVNRPLRSANSQYLATAYGDTARQQLSREHQVWFVLDAAEYARMMQLTNNVLWPYQSKNPDKADEAYLNALPSARTGSLEMKPLDSETGDDGKTVRWMKFSVTVTVPAGFRLAAELTSQKVVCGSLHPQP